jgi:uncharacterized protein YkwD
MARIGWGRAVLGGCVAAALVAPASAGAKIFDACDHAYEIPSFATIPEARRATLCAINVARVRNGVGILHTTPQLRATAKGYARNMVSHNFFAHLTPAGRTLLDRVRETDYLAGCRLWTLGENLGWAEQSLATPASMVLAWSNSPKHRRILLSSRFSEVGIGVAFGAPVPVAAATTAATYAIEFGARCE